MALKSKQSKVIWQLKFSENVEDSTYNVTGEQGLALQQLFLCKLSYFLNFILCINARGLKFGQFDVFWHGFQFLAFFNLQPIILWKVAHVIAQLQRVFCTWTNLNHQKAILMCCLDSPTSSRPWVSLYLCTVACCRKSLSPVSTPVRFSLEPLIPPGPLAYPRVVYGLWSSPRFGLFS